MFNKEIYDLANSYSSDFDYTKKETAIILAAGHGKRIKSQTSKMLHKIWEVPTVERVYEACAKSLGNANIIIVVGIKADEVIKTVGKKRSILYAYQEEQNGTGHAVQVALEKINPLKYNGTIYVFPGDMGLINKETICDFRNNFINSKADMLVLTGIFEGVADDNYYGRIIRVPSKNANKKSSDANGNVIEIIEYKDIMHLSSNKPYNVKYNKKTYSFKKKELINNREFNSSVYAFKYQLLNEEIKKIKSENVQNEIYLTDLISLFNSKGYKVSAVSPVEQYVLMGFNNKSVLKEMDAVARKLVYEKLKDIITIDDPDDFFIDEEVVDQILEMDKKGIPLDIKIGKGVYIGRGAQLNYNLTLMKNAYLMGDIQFGNNVVIKENAQLSCFYDQKLEFEDDVEIYSGNIIKGNVVIGKGTIIESGVRITGSDEFPTQIGSEVSIKGVTYIFGSQVDDKIFIEHSVLIKKRVAKPVDSGKGIFKVRFYLPDVEGKDGIADFKK
jgi:bifunctional UDP-N-acetylglucosamine pyrophosphorylase/glucosamine-1-phosphate N-acetyltransferase